MKFTLGWLKEYLETNADLDQICETLTAIGLEVEEVVDRSKNLAAFKVAQILEAKPHPDADKLQVCRVNTGEEELQIVCGAPNARAGINVVLAPVGTVIPTNGMKIKASKIRGVESSGMLCSAAELGLGEDHSGIIEMSPENDNIAKPYAEISGLNDPMIEIAITPNRGDCLGVYGIARDLAAAGLGTLKPLAIEEIAANGSSPIQVEIKEKEACPLFIGRYFKGVKNSPSPKWLQQRLETIGLRPISALVDITNYIAFTFGRPLHVYDANKLYGNLTVRKAQDKETIQALDEKEYTLDSSVTVIADDKAPHAIAGVIGGEDSGCDLETTDVFLEVALFDDVDVAKAGRKLDIITDSRYRFERKVDPAFLNAATEIASKMILDLCGGQASEAVIAGKEPEWQRSLDFAWEKTEKLSGVAITPQQSITILESLGFSISGNTISIPSWRPDIEGEADIVEEIVRIYGYDKIPTLPLPQDKNNTNRKPSRADSIRQHLASLGMNEAITWSFMQSGKAEQFGCKEDSLRLLNPISSEMDIMRPSILPNLLDAVVRNTARSHKDLALFELGLIFKSVTPEGQIPSVAGIRSGENASKNIYETPRTFDVFDAKSDALEALEAAGAPVDNLRVTRDVPSYFHPGRAGALCLGKNVLGYFGELHPSILKTFDIAQTVVGFEVFLNQLPPVKKKKGTARTRFDVSDYQASTRDFAFIVDAKTPVDDILRVAQNADKQLIDAISLFDIYQGKGIEEGKKSIAFSLLIQPKNATLTEEQLDALSQKVIKAVEKQGGTLRV